MNITPALLQRARQGDETAQSAIIAHLMPCIRRTAAASLVPGLEREDAEQEGLIALFRAIDTFDEKAGASFDTYAIRCIRNGINDARVRATRRKHQPLNQSVPLDETQSTPGPEEQAMHKEAYRATVRLLRTRLSATERRVLLQYLDGASYEQIAQKLDMDVKAVGNALTRVRTKLKKRQ